MKVDEVEKLINAFYEGNTSIEEEKALLHYFRTADVPEHLLAEKEMFLNLAIHEPEVPGGLEKKLSGLIDTWEQAEKEQLSIKPAGKINWRWVSGIAAGILLIFSVWTYTDYHATNVDTLQADTYANPDDALKEAQKALALVSKNLNKGMSQLESANSQMKKVDTILNKQFD